MKDQVGVPEYRAYEAVEQAGVAVEERGAATLRVAILQAKQGRRLHAANRG